MNSAFESNAFSHALSGDMNPWSPESRESSGWDWAQRLGAGKADAEQPSISGGVRSDRAARLEAVLLVADGPLSVGRISQFAMLSDGKEVRRLIQELNAAYDQSDCAFRVERVGTGYQLLTRREFAPWLDRLHQRHAALKLSPAAMETLTIVAYRQPITRADVESIRGVQSSEMLKQLMERGLVRIGGEDDSLGRPYLYVTTRQFLEVFGMHKLDDLPMSDTLRRKKPKPVKEAELGEGLFAEGLVDEAGGSQSGGVDGIGEMDEDAEEFDEEDAEFDEAEFGDEAEFDDDEEEDFDDDEEFEDEEDACDDAA